MFTHHHQLKGSWIFCPAGHHPSYRHFPHLLSLHPRARNPDPALLRSRFPRIRRRLDSHGHFQDHSKSRTSYLVRHGEWRSPGGGQAGRPPAELVVRAVWSGPLRTAHHGPEGPRYLDDLTISISLSRWVIPNVSRTSSNHLWSRHVAGSKERGFGGEKVTQGRSGIRSAIVWKRTPWAGSTRKAKR